MSADAEEVSAGLPGFSGDAVSLAAPGRLAVKTPPRAPPAVNTARPSTRCVPSRVVDPLPGLFPDLNNFMVITTTLQLVSSRRMVSGIAVTRPCTVKSDWLWSCTRVMRTVRGVMSSPLSVPSLPELTLGLKCSIVTANG